MTAAKIAAVDPTVNKSSDSDLKVIFRCSKIHRKEILQTGSWKFDGTLNPDTSEMIPIKLLTLLQWTRTTDEVNAKAVLLAQQIMSEVKTDGQVKHEHQHMRNRSITDVLHKLGVSVDYTRILRIEIQLAHAILSHSHGHGTYIPPALAKGQFIYFAFDNSDFSEDAPDGKTLSMRRQWLSFRGKQTIRLNFH